MTDISVTLTEQTVRALHGGWLGWLVDHPAVAPSMATRAGGLDFEHFAAALTDRRFTVGVSSIDGVDAIGLCVPVSDGPAWVLFALRMADAGASIDSLASAASRDLDQEIADLLGGEG